MRRSLLLALALGLAYLSPPGETVRAQPPRPKIEDVIDIEFPKDGYVFTLAEVAKGVKIPYKITIRQDYEGAIPMRFGPSFREPAGPSGDAGVKRQRAAGPAIGTSTSTSTSRAEVSLLNSST